MSCLQAEDEMEGIRYANIGIAVTSTIAIAGVLVFKDSSEAAMQAVALIGLLVGLAVSQGLDSRSKRRNKKRPQ
jgi:hypothetical protein